MKFPIAPFTLLKNRFNGVPLGEISCWVDDIQVPMKECCVGLEGDREFSNLEFWDAECASHPASSQCKVYED